MKRDAENQQPNLRAVSNLSPAEISALVSDDERRRGTGREEQIYTSRFSPEEDRVRWDTWFVLTREFFQPYVSEKDVVVDIGAGDGLFLLNLRARRKIAVDLSPHVRALEEDGIEVLQVPATDLSSSLDERPDVIFMSNFLEHLPDKRTLLDVLAECRRVLSPDGKILILQPNIRYAGVEYWDYIDHHIALTERSVVEALEVSGFEVVRMIPKFLPYTAKSKTGWLASLLPTRMVTRLYLKLPVLWRLFGAQSFFVATPGRFRA